MLCAVVLGLVNYSSAEAASENAKSDPLLIKANHLAAQKDYPGAENAYQTFLSQHPENVNAHHMYGRVLAILARYEEALKQYKKALELKSDDPSILTDTGVTLTICGQTELGAKFLHQAVVVYPKFPLGLNNLGAALFKLEAYGQSADFLGQSLAIQPHNARISELRDQAKTKLEQSKKFDFGTAVSWKDIPDKITISASTSELEPPAASTDPKSSDANANARKKEKKTETSFLEELSLS